MRLCFDGLVFGISEATEVLQHKTARGFRGRPFKAFAGRVGPCRPRSGGGIMRKQHPVLSAPGGENHPLSKPEIDYAPKEHTFGEMLRYGWKFLAVTGILIVLFWLVETYLY